ncbi:MAG: glucose-6-phosphate isomerase [Desulfovibrionaceae bacterium]|nr:glucose-6-phosphate isomerase [Desulfovibrionaceae bacterium]
MRHSLEWSHAIAGRINAAALEHVRPKYPALARLLETEVRAGRLPCLSLPFRAELEAQLAALLPLLNRFTHMLVLGIGGSALGARALQKAFFPAQDRPGHKGPWLWIADNVDADSLEACFAGLPPEQTVVVAISKSGGTIETLAQYFLARRWLQNALGAGWREHMLVVTDAKKGFLREEAAQNALASLQVPDHLGGRYSALSAVGLLPAAFLGMAWKDLLAGAWGVTQSLTEQPAAVDTHPALSLAAWNMALANAGYSQLIFFSYIPLWATLGPWFCQLWAESLGKEGKGTMPIAAVGVTDQHSVNQMFLDGPRDKGCLFLTCDGLSRGRPFPDELPDQWSWLKGRHFGDLLDAEALGTCMALTHSKTPLVRIHMADSSERAAGALMALLEAATLFTGWLMDINPIDQPAVELGKRLANARLGAPGYAAEEAELERFLSVPSQKEEF